jgi:hypothetical protein
MIREVASDALLDEAFAWRCRRRQGYSAPNDLWDLRRNWQRIRPELQKILLAGDYIFLDHPGSGQMETAPGGKDSQSVID